MNTIVAVSSGQGRAAIAVIRMSGSGVRFVIETVIGKVLAPRVASYVILRDLSGGILDRCIALFFEGPRSATGEDTLELHTHGSRGVVELVLQRLLGAHPDIRLAAAGEFTRRALENGKMDLLGVEALGDLLEAETPGQVVQAQRLMKGTLTQAAREWRDRLTQARALIEAELDFSDEGDVGSGIMEEARAVTRLVQSEIEVVVEGASRGARMRDGIVVAIVGPPNVGKSSLLNRLVERDAAIVSPVAGTTRDLIEVPVSFDGWPIIFVDSAGLRETTDIVEAEGVRRTRELLGRASVIIHVNAPGVAPVQYEDMNASLIRIWNKSDLEAGPASCLQVSAWTGEGVNDLRECLLTILRQKMSGEAPLVSRARQRESLERCLAALRDSLSAPGPEFTAEDLRRAAHWLGVLVGDVGLDEVLDRVFADFCIGK